MARPYRFFIRKFEVVPKPSRLSRAPLKKQPERGRKYLENQHHLALAMMADLQWYKKENKDTVYPLNTSHSIAIVYHMKGYKKIDRTNLEKAIEDALVKSGVIEDDSVKYLPDSDKVIIRQGAHDYWLAVELKEVDTNEPSLYELVVEVNEKVVERRKKDGGNQV